MALFHYRKELRYAASRVGILVCKPHGILGQSAQKRIIWNVRLPNIALEKGIFGPKYREILLLHCRICSPCRAVSKHL